MMEREFVAQKLKEFQIQEFIDRRLGNVGHSHTIMKKTPLGEKIIIFASRPGLVVGRRGGNIKDLTKELKKHFNLDNPQIEISEVENIYLDPNIVAEKIVSSLERFGTNRFKGIGHKMMEKIMESGARGIEIIVSGKVPGARARSWRFYQGYVKKCGDAAQRAVRKATKWAMLKPGIVGIRIAIMPPGIRLPDDIRMKEIVEGAGEQAQAAVEAEKKEEIEKKEEVKEEKQKEKRKVRKRKVKGGESESKEGKRDVDNGDGGKGEVEADAKADIEEKVEVKENEAEGVKDAA